MILLKVLPKYVFVQFCMNWLEIEGISNLDCATCNGQYRRQLLDCLKSDIFSYVDLKSRSCNFFLWLQFRNMSFPKLQLSSFGIQKSNSRCDFTSNFWSAIQSLTIDCCSFAASSFLYPISIFCTSLHTIRLTNSASISDSIVIALAKCCGNLAFLDLSNCQSLTVKSLLAVMLASQGVRCNTLNISRNAGMVTLNPATSTGETTASSPCQYNSTILDCIPSTLALTNLDMSQCGAVADSLLQKILVSSPTLQVLSLELHNSSALHSGDNINNNINNIINKFHLLDLWSTLGQHSKVSLRLVSMLNSPNNNSFSTTNAATSATPHDSVYSLLETVMGPRIGPLSGDRELFGTHDSPPLLSLLAPLKHSTPYHFTNMSITHLELRDVVNLSLAWLSILLQRNHNLVCCKVTGVFNNQHQQHQHQQQQTMIDVAVPDVTGKEGEMSRLPSESRLQTLWLKNTDRHEYAYSDFDHALTSLILQWSSGTLTSLLLDNIMSSAADLRAIAAQCGGLTELHLEYCTALTEALHAITLNCTRLSHLDLSASPAVCGDCLHIVASNCNRRLSTLQLSGSYHFNAGSMAALAAECTNLQHIDLSNTLVTDAAVVAIAQHCSQVRSLNLSGCYQHISDVSVLAIAQQPVLQNTLHTLLLAECWQLTNASIQQVLLCCKRLRLLDLRHCMQVSPSVFVPGSEFMGRHGDRNCIEVLWEEGNL